MLIIDSNLSGLVKDYGICDKSLIETFCLKIRLSSNYFKFKENVGVPPTVKYGFYDYNYHDYYEEISDEGSSIILDPGQQILACSYDDYKFPNNVFGLVQTKGTLARLFVQITCNDGQIEPGYQGKITLEIVNLSPFKVELPFFSNIGQIYLFNCSMTTETPYNGRYANAKGPTLPNFLDWM